MVLIPQGRDGQERISDLLSQIRIQLGFGLHILVQYATVIPIVPHTFNSKHFQGTMNCISVERDS